MSVPRQARYVVVGAGIHGLSTAYHLAKELTQRGLGSGRDVLVLDKHSPGSGASGIACGVVGSLLAVILLVVGKEFALPQIVPRFDTGSDVHAWPFPLIAVILLALGLTLGATGSALTLRRFLRI